MNWLRTVWVLAFVAASLGCSQPSPTDAAPQHLVGQPRQRTLSHGNLWYHIALADNGLDVHVRLVRPPRKVRFFLPGSWAGRDDYDSAISIVQARTSAGPAEFAMTRSTGEIEIAAPERKWVELHYRVDLRPRSAFHAQLDRGVLVAFAPTVLVMPAREILDRTRDVPIEVVVPGEWTVVSTWPLADTATSRGRPGSRVHGFVARDVEELRDAFIVAGDTLRTMRRGDGDRLIEVAFGPAFEGDVQGFGDLIETIVTDFRGTYGHVGPVHVYVRTRDATEETMDGVGRRSGFLLDVPPDAALDGRTRLLVAHEALHVWNGHRLIPDDDAESQTRWFKEGVTHYLALKSLAQRGVVGLDFVRDELSATAANYRRNPVSRGERGRPVDRARFPYDFGVLVALALDAALWDASAGAVGLEQWLVALLHRRDGRRYDESDLLETLQQLPAESAGAGVRSIWRRFVRGRAPIDLRNLFETVGLHWLPPEEDRPARLIELDRSHSLYRQLFTPREESP
jgi:predicted metalloprotease with PDZ domain